MEEQQKPLREELSEIKELLAEGSRKEKKPKPFRLPFSSRISKGNLKKGYVTVAVINDNMAVDFVKEPIIDGTIKLDNTFHAVEDFDIFNYKGKPFIFQPKSKLNPYNPLNGKHETYGQKYVMARMEGDKIVTKKKLGWGIGIVGLAVVAIIIYAIFTGGGG